MGQLPAIGLLNRGKFIGLVFVKVPRVIKKKPPRPGGGLLYMRIYSSKGVFFDNIKKYHFRATVP